MKKLFFLLVILSTSPGYAQEVGKPLPAWKEGMVDMHHINTGRGDAAFYIFPDGTTMLLDAGEMPVNNSPRRTKTHPDDSKLAHEWIVLYIKKFIPAISGGKIDYALITHFHDDHFGGYYPGAPLSKTGKYFRTGITGVGDAIGINVMIDRGYPDYQYPSQMKKLKELKQSGAPLDGELMGVLNYWDFIDYHIKNSGMKVEKLRAGRNDQIVLVHHPKKFPDFKIQNVKSSSTLWTGTGTETVELFASVPDSIRISENPLSNVIRVDYGDFRYYTGGDIPGIADLGQPVWNDVESPVAKAVGEVDVAVMDHHGNRDSHNEFNVKTLRPRVWIEQTWSSNHPGDEVLRRVTSQYLYPGPRDLFATNIMEANKIVIGPSLERAYKSMEGHILLRVMPGGKEYYIIILNDENTEYEVKAVFGPYQTKKKSKT